MSWIKPVFFATSFLISAVGLGFVAFQTWQQNRSNPNHGYTYNHQQERKKRQCSICLKEMNSSEEVILTCGHSFCSKCLTPLYLGTQTTCCVCLRELKPFELDFLRRRLNLG